MKNNLQGTIIFDNAGGVTVQLPGFAHFYGGYSGAVEQAAGDVTDYIKDGNADGWDGNDEDAAELDPDYDEINNGGYRVYSLDEVVDESSNDDSTGWDNIDRFCVELAKLIAE